MWEPSGASYGRVMTNNNSRRPATVWVAVGLLLPLAFLSCVGGYLFNLSGADELDDYVVGGVFVALGVLYLGSAVQVFRGVAPWRTVAMTAAVAHGVFNAVVKVGIEGETESLMFVGLTLALVAALVAPRTRDFFQSSRGGLLATAA